MSDDDLSIAHEAHCELMLDVTRRTLASDPELRLCEGLRLIEATRAAMMRLAPCSLDVLESEIMPGLKNILMERFGLSELPPGPIN